MKKFTILSVAILFLFGIASAATNVGEYIPSPLPTDEGGPDAFGYSWVDNDGGGGPEYNWIDISDIGVEVTDGLGDDNNVGPFSMGFEFPYYWYTANRCWIGSNGYPSFSSNANFAHPFAGIPTSSLPNDLIAVLTGDLDPSRGNPECYYYTNNADTFIVSWINFGEFGFIDSLHTFQVIFSAADSSILFQYGENHGNFRDSGGNNMTVIGIENVNGQVGLEYMHNNLPQDRLWHEGLAIKFHPEPDPEFEVFDFGIVDGFHEGSGADFIPNNEPYTIRTLAKNFGNQGIDDVDVRCQIRRGYTTVYNVTVTLAHLDPGEEVWVEFDSTFTPVQATTHRATFSAIMSGDQNANNNTKICELDPYELPQELRYCDDVAETGRSWTGDFSGFGCEFQMPEAIEVTSASFNVFAVSSQGPAYVWILPDDDGPDEDNPLAGDTVNVTSDGWYDLDFSDAGLTFAPNEKFYVVAIHAYQNTFSFAMDQSTPLSYRGWEYTGGLAPDRDRGVSDVMFKVYADATTGIDDEYLPKSFSVSQNYPNPFNARTNISFSIERESDVSIGIYNIAGQMVTDLSGHYRAGDHVVTWDASDVASGVYFYRVVSNDNSQSRKMVLLK
jgi:hypothetical protein